MNMSQEWRPVNYSRRTVLRFLDIILGIVELLLGVRIVLRLLGANPGSEFVAWLYGVTDQFIAPFAGIFPMLALTGNYVIEFSTLFAMLVYAFLGWTIIRVISFLTDAVLRIYA